MYLLYAKVCESYCSWPLEELLKINHLHVHIFWFDVRLNNIPAFSS